MQTFVPEELEGDILNDLMEEINALADDIKGLKFEITIKEKENHEK